MPGLFTFYNLWTSGLEMQCAYSFSPKVHMGHCFYEALF